MENTFIGLPTKFVKVDTDCDNKMQEAENLGVSPERYCPECIDKKKEDGIYYIRLEDIEDFSFDGGFVQLKRYNQEEGNFYRFELSEEAFLTLLEKAGSKIFTHKK
jgi:hypothetical protein